METRNFILHGHKWNEVCRSSLGEGYVLIKRPLSMSQIKAHPMQASAIDVKFSELPEDIKDLVREEDEIRRYEREEDDGIAMLSHIE